MKEEQIFNQLFFQCFNTFISTAVIAIIAIGCHSFFKRKITSQKQLNKIKSRVIYIATIITILVIVRIWIEGFYHLFTMLSLVAAGLVIVNKENVMNFSGWIIINWRSLFSEGDSIQVQSYIGKVVGIRLLYFTINETYYLGDKKTTGKIIKIPNSLIITAPVTTFPNDDAILLHKVSFTTNVDTALDISKKVKQYISNKIKEKYGISDSFKESKVFSKAKLAKISVHSLEPKIDLIPIVENDSIITVKVHFYCLAEDSKSLELEFISYYLETRSKI
ncbi:mechanosensitive ion channel domain-containing protein [Francisella adeliensis]|uniref:Mechanosensitive ion channel n=1 Tax=Francisella adeliensis TaxID=2007306 RepID=A0A2Z4XY25_9GAMM|nr:mechanosensitive ion channel domain-containing protein [Francisella adeliensis]AXA33807.1 hypothetical protein CDH04_04975 [Francisella adeliensis]MBK2085706.1 mechanosensitive ion channel [Francisella adeliensis]MBK2097584.1 mechanosensitive ion channel [Francisella adeliensis]QIW12042.1 mechanosensitive ion channel [Francisella adeliensis]QIW13917.1 mechanosensitive ion channel [Francisella adeliensis]